MEMMDVDMDEAPGLTPVDPNTAGTEQSLYQLPLCSAEEGRAELIVANEGVSTSFCFEPAAPASLPQEPEHAETEGIPAVEDTPLDAVAHLPAACPAEPAALDALPVPEEVEEPPAADPSEPATHPTQDISCGMDIDEEGDSVVAAYAEPAAAMLPAAIAEPGELIVLACDAGHVPAEGQQVQQQQEAEAFLAEGVETSWLADQAVSMPESAGPLALQANADGPPSLATLMPDMTEESTPKSPAAVTAALSPMASPITLTPMAAPPVLSPMDAPPALSPMDAPPALSPMDAPTALNPKALPTALILPDAACPPLCAGSTPCAQDPTLAAAAASNTLAFLTPPPAHPVTLASPSSPVVAAAEELIDLDQDMQDCFSFEPLATDFPPLEATPSPVGARSSPSSARSGARDDTGEAPRRLLPKNADVLTSLQLSSVFDMTSSVSIEATADAKQSLDMSVGPWAKRNTKPIQVMATVDELSISNVGGQEEGKATAGAGVATTTATTQPGNADVLALAPTPPSPPAQTPHHPLTPPPAAHASPKTEPGTKSPVCVPAAPTPTKAGTPRLAGVFRPGPSRLAGTATKVPVTTAGTPLQAKPDMSGISLKQHVSAHTPKCFSVALSVMLHHTGRS